MKPPPPRRTSPEAFAVDVLRAAGLNGSTRRPASFPNCGPFVVVFLNGGERRTKVTTTAAVEVEAWGTTKTAAKATMDDAVAALVSASWTRGVREVAARRVAAELPTGVEGWQRYTLEIEIEERVI